MYCDLVSRERLSEDVRRHILSWAILDLRVPIGYGLMNKMKVYVDMFSTSMVVVIRSKVDGGLVVTKEDGCYITVGTFAQCGLSSTAKTLRSLEWWLRF